MLSKASFLTFLVVALSLFACGQVTSESIKTASSSPSQDKSYNGTPDDFELRQTEKLLGVRLQNFPEPQGPTKFDDLSPNRPSLQFTAKEQPVSGPTPQPSYERRPIVNAKAPDGSVYEAYCTRDLSAVIAGSYRPSTPDNTRQIYGTHYGYAYTPEDVYIGKRVAGRLQTALFFPDVGSHDTAPHHLAIDNNGMVHLIVADVNIYQDNRLDLYWVIGDPATGKWNCAEVSTQQTFGFGKWQFWVEGSIDKMDKNVVLGLFNYSGHDGFDEMDIEWARWGNARYPNCNYTVWPAQQGFNNFSFAKEITLSSNNTTQRFTSTANSVLFQTLQGFKDDNTNQIATATCTAPPNSISTLPMPAFINLWLFQGHAPSNKKGVEIIIHKFTYTP